MAATVQVSKSTELQGSRKATQVTCDASCKHKMKWNKF